jgi:hypothetical protein
MLKLLQVSWTIAGWAILGGVALAADISMPQPSISPPEAPSPPISLPEAPSPPLQSLACGPIGDGEECFGSCDRTTTACWMYVCSDNRVNQIRPCGQGWDACPVKKCPL